MNHHWLIWQLVDSAFPAGSFAHSGGLEAAWQQGCVRRGESLVGFIETALSQAARGSVPFVLSAHHEPVSFAELDLACDAFLTNHVTNRASRAQGQSLLAAAVRIFRVPELAELQRASRTAGAPMHLAPVMGIVAEALTLDAENTARLFLFWSLRGLVSSAIRLGIIGPMEAQAMQARMTARAESLVQSSLKLRAPDATQTAPFLDLLQGAQDRLYSRLFQS